MSEYQEIGDIGEFSAYNMIFKLVIVGESYTGKTNILTKYLNNTFNNDSKATVGVEFGSKTLSIDGNMVKAQIWDTAGQERYRAITSAYYKGAKGAFLVYDISNRKTFETVDKWMPEIKSQGSPNINIILIGNKSDLENDRQVTLDEGKEKAKKYNVAFIETSALTGQNINEAFSLMINEVYKNCRKKFETESKIQLINGKPIETANNNPPVIKEVKKEKSGFCC